MLKKKTNRPLTKSANPEPKDTTSIDWIIWAAWADRITFEEMHPSSPSFEQKQPDDSTKESFIDIAEEISGHTCCAVNYATEAPYIQQLGCQTIVLGPGSINQAHQPNEFLAHSEIDKTEKLLTQMIQRYCL